MPQVTSFNIGGINLYTNPLIHSFETQVLQQDGQLIRAVNVDTHPHGAKIKRPGYITYLGTPDAGSVYSLFSWLLDNGTQLYTYRASGSILYYSTQGTGAWTTCGGGTITPGSQVGYGVLNNNLTISQNGGTTRNSTNGTSFTDTSAAPAGGYIEQAFNRIFITGTSSTLTYSVTGDPTNWSTTGTSDSSSITIPGGGLPNKLFKLNNRLFISKAQSQLFKWDGYNLLDMAGNMGISSPFSYGSIQDSGVWLNRLGIFMSNGDQPDLISNPVQRYIYNDSGSAMAGTSFGAAPGVGHKFDYYCAIGTTTDDFTYEPTPNAILKYNFVRNEFHMYSFSDFPNSFHSYRDTNGSIQMIFGNSAGQCFTYGGTALNDNAASIESIMEFVFNFNAPHLTKEWRNWWGFFNPGCQAQILFATSDTFLKEEKTWQVLGDARSGKVFYRFPNGARSNLLYIKIIESSRNTRFDFYGQAIEANVVPTP